MLSESIFTNICNRLDQYDLIKPDFVARKLANIGVNRFGQLAHWLWQLPYGRNVVRSDYISVIDDKHGTCSTKHGLFKFLAEQNNLGIKLMRCTFEMNTSIDKRLAPFLAGLDIGSFLECHCYLKLEGERFDISLAHVEPMPFKLKILSENEISLSELGEDKVLFHKQAMREWLKSIERD